MAGGEAVAKLVIEVSEDVHQLVKAAAVKRRTTIRALVLDSLKNTVPEVRDHNAARRAPEVTDVA
jgi:hypothetical protein